MYNGIYLYFDIMLTYHGVARTYFSNMFYMRYDSIVPLLAVALGQLLALQTQQVAAHSIPFLFLLHST